MNCNFLKKTFIFTSLALSVMLLTFCNTDTKRFKDQTDYAQKANAIVLESDHAKVYISKRPAVEDRLFISQAIERKIAEVTKQLTNARLRWMFENCFPNTIDTTVRYYTLENGDDDTLVYTGDIHAMWLRDSGAQVWPYVQLANEDEALKKMLRGTILRQFRSIILDPYANAFLDPNDPNPDHQWMDDETDMKPELHERKWEIDSVLSLRLA